MTIGMASLASTDLHSGDNGAPRLIIRTVQQEMKPEHVGSDYWLFETNQILYQFFLQIRLDFLAKRNMIYFLHI
jgi:urease beta subunit